MTETPRRDLWCVPGPADHDYYISLYGRARHHGVDVRVTTDLTTIPADTSDAIIHAHWLSIWGVSSTKQARETALRDIAALDHLLNQNCRLIWTVHEPLPHNPYHRHEEIQFRQALADRATVIHLLSDATFERSEGIIDFGDTRTVTTDVPSALDHVARVTRDESRIALGLPDDVDVILVPGNIKLYKEHEVLARAILRRQADGTARPCVALVAGAVLTGVDAVVTRLGNLGAAVIARGLSGVMFHRLLAGVDAIVLPYSAGLNSGVLPMAVAVGTPVVASTQVQLPQFDFMDDCYFFDLELGDAGVDQALATALGPSAGEDFARYAATVERRFSAQAIADAFFEEALAIIDISDPADFNPLAFNEPTVMLRERFLLARAQVNPVVRSMSMIGIAELAREDGDPSLEWDARVEAGIAGGMRTGVVENARRLLELGRDFYGVAKAERTVHKMVDGRMESAEGVLDMVQTLVVEDSQFDQVEQSFRSRIDVARMIPEQKLLAQTIEGLLSDVR